MRCRLTASSVIVLAMLAPALSRADQAAWISKKDAEAAAARIKPGDEVREYCKPCGDKAYDSIRVSTVAVAAVGDGQYYEVRLNGRGIDLAYIYIRTGGGWENLAMLVGVPVENVPRFLPTELPPKRK